MAARPGEDAAAPSTTGDHEPLPPRLFPARGVVLGVVGGVLIWAALVLAYVYMR